MSLSKFYVLALGLFLSLSSPVQADFDPHTLNLQLGKHLSHIESISRQTRITSGIITVGGGLVFGGLALGARSNTYSNDLTLGYGIMGGVLVGAGVYTLLVPTEFETTPQKYSALPQGTPQEELDKVKSGEAFLERLKESAYNERMVSGATLLGLAVGEFAFYMSLGASPALQDCFKGYLYASVITVVPAILSFALESTPEIEYKNYHNWKKGAQPVSKLPTPFLAPQNNGWVAGLTFKF